MTITPDTLEYREDQPAKEDFVNLYATTGWRALDFLNAEDFEEALKHSWYMLAAYHEGQLVGFGRVLSDGIYHAFICEMIVRPTHQGQGIGQAILERLIAKCQAHNILQVQLFSASGKAGFYKKFGFEERAPDAPGMQLSR
ncbi:MAG: GNAT family N-acetyltransferase [Chloroflexi bacterium]|mgnify:CR=1 FL=1|nr:GNAT family N-acetyltransferase [Chloroflexota bacterium]OJV97815.1 MAG: hypothetical protein BGO39_07820 [Chloroflexi bacterium 54-19]